MLRPMQTSAIAADDLTIVAALRRGEERAFADLVDRYEELMLRVASRYVRSTEVAQEVVQDTWLNVLGGIHGFEARASLKTWIFRILVNRAKTHGMRESRSVPFSSLAGDGTDEGLDADHLPDRRGSLPEDRVFSRQTVERARRAIERLPRRQRDVIALIDVKGCSSEEVC